jgi:hypothetical protein
VPAAVVTQDQVAAALSEFLQRQLYITALAIAQVHQVAAELQQDQIRAVVVQADLGDQQDLQ